MSDLAVRYTNAEFIADQASPVVKAGKRSDKYAVYSRRDVHSIPDAKIGPTSRANLSSYTTSTANFSVEDFALLDYVSSQTEANADAPFRPQQDAVDFNMQKLMLLRERRVAALLFNAAAYATANKTTITNEWDDTTNGVPVDDILTGIDACAEPPTHLIIGAAGWKALRRHPQVISTVLGLRTGQVGPGMISRQQLAEWLELEAILVGKARYDSANPGQTVSLARVWDDDQALLARIIPNPGTKTITLSKTFRFSETGNPSIAVRQWDEPSVGKGGSVAVQCEHSDDEVIVAADAAYHFSNVVS